MDASTIINERYQILGQIGKGGMAFVYKAKDLTIKRIVAIKIIRTDRKLTPASLKRFDREAKFLAKLDHPNIVRLFDYGEHEGLPYFVMEYVDGDTLKKRMGQPIKIAEAARMLAPVARGLAFAHELGIIHRDIKPSNILITADGTPKISDFGIAKLAESEMTMDLTGANVSVGTPEYMSPEQGLGKPIDGRTDIYSLGVVMYEMVTGKKPFTADTPLGVLHQHVTEPALKPSACEKSFPASMDAVILTALEKEPSKRYSTMQAFAGILEQVGAGEKTVKLSKVVQPKKKAGALPLILAGAAVLLLAAGILWFAGIFKPQAASAPATSEASSLPVEETSTAALTTAPSTATTAPTENPDSKAITLGGDALKFDSARIDESNTGQVVQKIEKQLGPLTNMELSPNNRYLLASTITAIKVLDSQTLEDAGEYAIGKRITSFKVSPDGKTIAVLVDDQTVQLWDAETKILKGSLTAVTEPVSSIAYSDDGKYLAAGTQGGWIYIIDLASQTIQQTIQDQKQAILTVCFSHDGSMIAAGSADHSVRVWQIDTGISVWRLWDFSDVISALAFSPDGQYLIAAPNNSQFNLYTIADGKLVRSYTGHTSLVTALIFTPNSNLIVSGSQDQKVRIWPLDSGYVSAILENHLSRIIKVIVSEDGSTIFSASQDGKINAFSIQ